MKIKTLLFLFLLYISTTLFSQNSATNLPKAAENETILINLEDPQYAGTSLNDVLKKYKGKVIYLDFWASWCNPCRQEMPNSMKLQQQFKGKDVVFLYMSTDKNAKAWKDMIAQLGLTGLHYRSSEAVRQQIIRQFNLQYIPRYVLIDKTGKVVYDDAKRPGHPSLVNDINNLL